MGLGCVFGLHYTHAHPNVQTPIYFQCILSMAVHLVFSTHSKLNFANFLFFHFRFYSGELEVARAKNVILYTTLSNKSQERELNGLCGLLVITNFKLSFLTQDNEQVCGSAYRKTIASSTFMCNAWCLPFLSISTQNITYQENFFLQRNDVTLQNIDCIYQIVDRKKRLVGPCSKVHPKLDGLLIVCKVSG